MTTLLSNVAHALKTGLGGQLPCVSQPSAPPPLQSFQPGSQASLQELLALQTPVLWTSGAEGQGMQVPSAHGTCPASQVFVVEDDELLLVEEVVSPPPVPPPPGFVMPATPPVPPEEVTPPVPPPPEEVEPPIEELVVSGVPAEPPVPEQVSGTGLASRKLQNPSSAQ